MRNSRSVRNRIALFSLALVMGLAGQGCVLSQATEGTGISDEQVARIEPGTSTRADVTRILGAPDRIIYSNETHDPLFERVFEYDRTRRRTTFFTVILFSTARSDSNADRVMVFFDDDGVVEDIGVRLDMDRPRYGTPWSDDG